MSCESRLSTRSVVQVTDSRLQLPPRDDFTVDAFVEESSGFATERLDAWGTVCKRKQPSEHQVLPSSAGDNFRG